MKRVSSRLVSCLLFSFSSLFLGTQAVEFEIFSQGGVAKARDD